MAAVTYGKPSISGYNATPPADDGSQVASNEVTWSKHKDKFGDPLKNYSDAINDAIDATVASMGTVADQDIGKTSTTVNQGGLVQRVITEYTTYLTHSTNIPIDNTVPQNTEGDEIMTAAITPNATANRLMIRTVVHGAPTAAVGWTVAIFQDSTANALSAAANTDAIANAISPIECVHEMAAGTTSATTFKVRVGSTANAVVTNGINSSQYFNGVYRCYLIVEEYA